jgi:hypothetical protein
VIEPFGAADELPTAKLMERLLLGNGISTGSERIAAILAGSSHRPLTLITLPKVLGADVDQASETAHREAAIKTELLSMTRNGYGEIVGAIRLDRSDGGLAFYVPPKLYRGNYAGGDISGESRSDLYAKIERVRNDSSAQLYVSLLNTSVREENVEHRYFRLWSLLETVARSKGYVGRPRLDWGGSQIRSKKGKPQHIEDHAEALVFELLREKFSTANFSLGSGRNLAQGSVEQLIAIWYRHRNCAGHRGGCFSSDPQFCLPNDAKFLNCNKAHCEMVARSGTRTLLSDEYLGALEETARFVVMMECQ